jgi:hypothetical protein
LDHKNWRIGDSGHIDLWLGDWLAIIA